MSHMSVMEDKTRHNCKIAAHQTLYTKQAIEQGLIIGSAVGEEIASHVFSSKTSFSITAADATGLANSFTGFSVSPRGNNTIEIPQTFAADGSSAGGPNTDVEGYAEWAANFDSIRMVACSIEVHNTSRTDNINGEILMYQTPYGTGSVPTWAIQSSYPHVCKAAATPGDMYRCAWISEVASDSEFGAITDVPAADETSLVFAYRGLPESSATQSFAVDVFQVWEATTQRDNTLLTTAMHNIDHTMYLNHILADVKQMPQWSRARNVVPDGGPFSFVTDLYGDVKKTWKDAKRLFGKGLTITERAAALKDLYEDGLGLGGRLAPFLTAREKAANMLVSMKPELVRELVNLSVLTRDELIAISRDLHSARHTHYKVAQAPTPLQSGSWDTVSRR